MAKKVFYACVKSRESFSIHAQSMDDVGDSDGGNSDNGDSNDDGDVECVFVNEKPAHFSREFFRA